MAEAYLNRISTAVPDNEVHQFFLELARGQLGTSERDAYVFERMVEMGGIDRRFCCLSPANDRSGGFVDQDGLFRLGAFPSTGERMKIFKEHAPVLAERAVRGLELGNEAGEVTHLIVTSCTGFYAPGVDLDIVARCGLDPSVERTIVGFMGCYAAINALKLARHVVRSEPQAKVLVVNLELCTLHLQETDELEKLLSFYLWGDGCAASLVTAEETGLRLDSFHAVLAPDTGELMTWDIGDVGFDMVLSGQVPRAIRTALTEHVGDVLGGASTAAIDLWAVHPGGRSVLDSVQRVLQLPPAALSASRHVLRSYGNMSSATIVFVLKELMENASTGDRGCAMAFGPGLVAETMLFQNAA